MELKFWTRSFFNCKSENKIPLRLKANLMFQLCCYFFSFFCVLGIEYGQTLQLKWCWHYTYITQILSCVTWRCSAVQKEEKETALCTALRYCDRGNMHQALWSLGLFFSERSQIITLAQQMGRRRCSCHPSCNYFGTCCPDANTQRKSVQVIRYYLLLSGE